MKVLVTGANGYLGQGIVKQEVHNVLKNNKKVKEYKTDNFNSGCTIVKLDINLQK